MKKIPAKFKRNPRYQSVLALQRVAKGSYSNLLLKEIIDKGHLSKEDAALFTEIVYGSLMYDLNLDYQLQPFLKNPQKLPPFVLPLLKSAVFQLFYLDRVPDHAVLNESVEIGKFLGGEGLGKLINGVLRNVLRQGLRDTATISDPYQRLEKAASFPKELIEFLVPQLGFEKVEALAWSILKPAHVSARVNTNKISRKQAQEYLAEEGLETEFSTVSEDGLVGKKGFLAGSRLFEEGLLTIQDESSMLVAPALTLDPDFQVLDCCAAPGGKTTHLASFLTSGKVTALDLHPHKVALIKENAKRLHVEDRIIAGTGDARQLEEKFSKETFDAILVDAPCSGLGLMRRKPDIKYQKKREDFLNLAKIQLEILESAAKVLKKGGIMVYSTCTITKCENEEVVAAFLQKHPEFVLEKVPLSPFSSVNFSGETLTLYPQDYNTDGFFISRMRKVA